MPTFKDHMKALELQNFRILGAPRGFSDAEGMMFMAKELEAMEARTYQVLYQDLFYKTLFPVKSDVPPGARTTSYKVFDKRGKGRWLNTKAWDLPRVDVDGREVITPQHWNGASAGWSMAEIEAAAFAGVPLEQAKLDALRRALEEEMNEVAFSGNADLNLTGFFTVGNGIPRTTAPNGGGGTPQWDTKTPDEIIADIGLLFSKPVEDSKQKERPTELWLPTAQYNDIANRRLTDTGETLFSYIVQKSPWISSADKIISVPNLAAAGTAGVDVAVAASRNPEKLEQNISMDVTFHPVRQEGLNWVVPGTIVYGGLIIRYPLAFHILEDV